MDNKKLIKIIKILVGILIILGLAFGGLYLYRKIINRGIVTESVKVGHESDNSEIVETVVLNEEDVKNWLGKNNNPIEFFYVRNENDFDLTTATKKEYNSFLGLSILFGGLTQDNSIESITLNDGKYNYQYSYPITFIKNLLNEYFGVGVEVIDIEQLNSDYKEVANFSMDENKFTVKVIATGLDDYKTIELTKIILNSDNNIVVNYELKNCSVDGSLDNCKKLENREVVLKKTTDGYNILKAYKVD